METNGVGLVLDNLLKVKHLVTLKEQVNENTIIMRIYQYFCSVNIHF